MEKKDKNHISNNHPSNSIISQAPKNEIRKAQRSKKYSTNGKYSEKYNGIIYERNFRFPTFNDKHLNKRLHRDLSSETLFKDILSTYEKLAEFITLYYEAKDNTELREQMEESSMSYPVILVELLFLLREIKLWQCIFILKYDTKNVQKYNVQMEEIIAAFRPLKEPANYFTYQVSKDYQEELTLAHLTEETKNAIIDKIETLFGFEEIFFKENTQDYLPSKAAAILVMKFIGKLVNDLGNTLNDIKVKLRETNIVNFFRYLAQLQIVTRSFHLIFLISEKDLFSQSETSPEWIELKENYERVKIFKKDHMNKNMKKVFDFVNIGYAGVSKAFENKNDLLRKAGTGLYCAYYFFNKKKAQIQSKKFLMKPDGVISQTIWNMLDTNPLKQMMRIALPPNKYTGKFFLKKTAPIIDYERIAELTNNIKNFVPTPPIILYESSPNTKTTLLPKIQKSDNEPELLLDKLKPSLTNEEYVKVKLIHSSVINSDYIDNGIMSKLFAGNNETKNSMIFHVHGGGFIAMSPSSHYNYTRKWVNELGVPLMSIDYRLSPEYPFPKALDDVYQAYVWLVTYGETYFNIKLDNIILAGDSAGGNLVAALTYLIIMNNLQMPSALFMFYPAIKMSLDKISLSYLNSITDPVLEYNLLTYCVEAYIGQYDDHKNPFLNPLFMDDNILKLLPPVRIIGGSADPLRDDGIYLLQKLTKLDKDAKMIELKYFPHGFLNYDMSLMMPDAHIANKIIIQEMEKFIKYQAVIVESNVISNSPIEGFNYI